MPPLILKCDAFDWFDIARANTGQHEQRSHEVAPPTPNVTLVLTFLLVFLLMFQLAFVVALLMFPLLLMLTTLLFELLPPHMHISVAKVSLLLFRSVPLVRFGRLVVPLVRLMELFVSLLVFIV